MPKSQSPTLADIFEKFGENLKADVWTALPARVQSYDEVTQRVLAAPVVKNVYYDENDERRTENLPPVSANVLFMGAGDFRLTFPIVAGDLGLLVHTSCSLDQWVGGTGGDVDPKEERRNHLSDAFFIPGIFPRTAPTTAPLTAMVLHTDGATAALLLGGPDANDPIMRRSDFQAWLNGAYASHTHPVPGITTGSSATTSTGTAAGTAPACSPVVRSK